MLRSARRPAAGPPSAAALLAILVTTALAGCSGEDPLPGEGDDEGRTVVYRDTWGVAHIYAPTAEAGLYAMGWAQAEDRPAQLLRNFALAMGEYAAEVGEAAVPSDLRARMWDHYGVGQRALNDLSPGLRAHVDAFAQGMNDFYDAHPEDVPEWWGERRVDSAMVLAFGRLFLYNWSVDEAYEDLIRGGVEPSGFEPTARGSNQFAVAPSRSAEGAAILAIDPHLAWEGPSRFWEVRIHAGELVGSGVTLPGSPYIGLGHNRHVAWAMTTGGPDTADVYELTLNDDDPTRYLYDGEWLPLESREVALRVAGEEEPRVHTLWRSRHGPIVARQGDRAYAAKIAYGELVTLEAWRLFSTAESYEGIVEGMATLTLFPQNVMVADTSGNIYYQRTGRVPIRADGFDWSRPVNGSTSASEWQGFHPASDHLQVLNPPQGWMQNCNIPPDAMLPGSPFQPGQQADYLFSGPGYGPALAGWTNQRGARAIELLSVDDSVTVEEAMDYINDVRPYGADRWIEALRTAHERLGARFAEASDLYDDAMASLLAWDGALDRDSQGGLKYALFREQLAADLDEATRSRIEGGVDSWYSIVSGEDEPPVTVAEADQELLLESFVRAMEEQVAELGSLDAVYGDRYRVGRGEASWPVGGGGGRVGLTTLRNMGYGPEREDDHQRWGRGGQTSTQIVVLSDPPQSWMVIPLGQSDRPDSPHYDDQAEKLFSPRRLKDTWWLPQELAGNVESRTVLDAAPAAAESAGD